MASASRQHLNSSRVLTSTTSSCYGIWGHNISYETATASTTFTIPVFLRIIQALTHSNQLKSLLSRMVNHELGKVMNCSLMKVMSK